MRYGIVNADAAIPGVPVPAGRKGFKAELDGLRERMRGRGFSVDEIAAEIGRRYRVRPREAYRLAWGWSLEKAAGRFNDHACRQDADAEGRASLTASRLSEFEHWPQTARKPSVYVLAMLAEVYQTDVLCLLDFADHESLPQRDLMVLTRRPRAGTPFGEKLAALMDTRGLSLRETARRVSCSAGYLSGVIQGRRRPSGRMTARLEDVLAAGGELTALAQAAGVVTREDQNPPAPGDPGGPVREIRTAPGEGFSLSLPYVPGRLVIEVSGPAATPGLAAGENAAIAGGRLTLVRDVTSPGTSSKGVTGA
jgi:transcriptional regulator with XRE-family HTH domain